MEVTLPCSPRASPRVSPCPRLGTLLTPVPRRASAGNERLSTFASCFASDNVTLQRNLAFVLFIFLRS